jgi:hypothetical protein
LISCDWAQGVQEFRSSGVQEFRSSGVQEFKAKGETFIRIKQNQIDD